MTTDKDLVTGLEFKGAKNCDRLFVAEIDGWMVYSLESNGIRKFSMLATLEGHRFGDDHLIKLRKVCEKNRFPMPLELASKTVKNNYVITGLLYPSFQTIQQYYGAKGSTPEFASIIKSLLSKLVDLHGAKQYPWTISSTSIVILDGTKGAWFLNPYHNSSDQSMRSLNTDLSELHTMLTQMLSDADRSGLMSCFLDCLMMANTSSRVKRLLKCPLFYSHPDEYWTLIANAYEGLHDRQYELLLEKKIAECWQTRLVVNSARKRGEMMAVLDCAIKKCRMSETFAELVTYLRHFKQYGNQRRMQMLRLIAIREKLNCKLTKANIHTFPNTDTKDKFCYRVGMSHSDYKTHLQTLLDCLNLDYFNPSTGPTVTLDWGLFKEIDELYENFFSYIFYASFKPKVQKLLHGFD